VLKVRVSARKKSSSLEASSMEASSLSCVLLTHICVLLLRFRKQTPPGISARENSFLQQSSSSKQQAASKGSGESRSFMTVKNCYRFLSLKG